MESHALPSSGGQRGGFPLRLPLSGDERLATLIARGDQAAFRHLYERYHQPLYRYCRSLLHHDADAQDALQSTFAAAYAALRDARRNAPMRPWLFRIAHNEAVSLLRRRRPDQELTSAHDTGAPSLEEHVEERERLAMLVSDLRELPEQQRGALVMRELSGLSHDEIALALDVSPNAAKQTIFAARKSMSELAEGRAMSCDEVCRLISDADGRVLRSRKVRAHLRSCRACTAFAAAIPARSSQLRALAPALPGLAAGGIFARVAATGSGHGSQGIGLVAGGAGKAVSTAVLVKSTATAVVVAATATAGLSVALKHHASTSHGAGSRAARLHSAGGPSAVRGPAATSGAIAVAAPGARRAGSLKISRPPVVRGRAKHPAVASVVNAGIAGAASTAAASLTPLKSGHGAGGGSRGSARSQNAPTGYTGAHVGGARRTPLSAGSSGSRGGSSHRHGTGRSTLSSTTSGIRHVHRSSPATAPQPAAPATR